jgi:hypothetical protein
MPDNLIDSAFAYQTPIGVFFEVAATDGKVPTWQRAGDFRIVFDDKGNRVMRFEMKADHGPSERTQTAHVDFPMIPMGAMKIGPVGKLTVQQVTAGPVAVPDPPDENIPTGSPVDFGMPEEGPDTRRK